MKRKLLPLFLIAFFLFASPLKVLAIELPERLNQIGDVYTPKVLPDSPWYFIKSLRDRLQILFVLDPTRKAYLELDLANKKTLELQQLCEIGKCNYTNTLTSDISSSMTKVTTLSKEESLKGKDVSELVNKIVDNSIKQQVILKRLAKISPPENKDSLIAEREGINDITKTFVREIQGSDAYDSYLKEVNDSLPQ